MMSNSAWRNGAAVLFLTTLTRARVPIASLPTPENVDYLRTKRDRMGHLIDDLPTTDTTTSATTTSATITGATGNTTTSTRTTETTT